MTEHKTPITMHTCANSSHVDAHGYDPLAQTLAVRFKGGQTYHYYGVPVGIYEELKQADSVGNFLNMHIVPAFKYAKIGE